MVFCPQYMREHFIPQYGVHTYNTRLSSKGAFVIPKVKSHGHKSFCYNGCSLWNSLPHAFREISNMSHFKVTLKQHLQWICVFINCDLFVCMLPVYQLCLNHNSVYLSVTCNTIQSIVISIYIYLSVNCIFRYACFPKPK